MVEWLYRRLLSLYPAVYLRDYRELMEQAFRDQLRDAPSTPRRIALYLAAINDVARGALTMHLELETGVLSMGALFIAMCLLLCATAALTHRSIYVESLLGLCALAMGYLDPGHELIWEGRVRRWSYRLVLATILIEAACFWGGWLTSYRPGLLGLGFLNGGIGARFRCRRSPEFHGLLDLDPRGPALIELGLREKR